MGQQQHPMMAMLPMLMMTMQQQPAMGQQQHPMMAMLPMLMMGQM
jgi:hypothetical protein